MSRSAKQPYDAILGAHDTWIVSRTGKLRPWRPAMARGLARLRRYDDPREFML